jgi:hypothetical protein
MAGAAGVLPVWALARTVEGLTGLGRKRLNDLVGRGEVRSAKTGDARQAGRVYRVSDVLDWLEKRADEGKVER